MIRILSDLAPQHWYRVSEKGTEGHCGNMALEGTNVCRGDSRHREDRGPQRGQWAMEGTLRAIEETEGQREDRGDRRGNRRL
jgi:hypothetical protein